MFGDEKFDTANVKEVSNNIFIYLLVNLGLSENYIRRDFVRGRLSQ
jgi:hypothetical protein